MTTAYLSLTRGDGGQNLIGPELGDQLGVIRTQELLAARRIDHGQQFFTRANDFGFSKSSAETLRIWDREKILGDAVWAIRKFRPGRHRHSVPSRMTTRRMAITPHPRSSRRKLSEPRRIRNDFPSSLSSFSRGRRRACSGIRHTFFFRARNLPFDPTGLILLEAGGYQPLLGKSYAEIDAASRTMHKSQGFGVSIERGEQKEYFKFLEGKPVEGGDLFSGIDTTWGRVPKAADAERENPRADRRLRHEGTVRFRGWPA